MIRKIVLVLFIFQTFSGFAQITTNPGLPINSKAVTIIFDSSKDSRLGKYTGDLYAHTGVSIEGKGDWQHVIESWGNNTTQPKLTNKGNGIYELQISPSINSFYSVPANELVKKMCLVFRSADSKKQTGDLFIDVATEALAVKITSPQTQSIFEKNQIFSFTASSTTTADLKLFIDNQQIAAQTGTSITQTSTIPASGNYWLKTTATQNSEVVRDSVYVCIRETSLAGSRPSGIIPGINYIDNQTFNLELLAPGKNYVFVVGDFNNWLPDVNYQMKKDGDFFWLTLANLEPAKEYIFQYLIDGQIQVADPYADKISDPDDKYIPSSVYPNPIANPAGNVATQP